MWLPTLILLLLLNVEALENQDLLGDTWKMTLLIAGPLVILAVLVVLLLRCCIIKPSKRDKDIEVTSDDVQDAEAETATQIETQSQNDFLAKQPEEKKMKELILLDAVKSCDPTAVNMNLCWQLNTEQQKAEIRAALNLASDLLHEKVKMMPAPRVGAIAQNPQYKKQRQQQQEKVKNLNEIIELLSVKLDLNREEKNCQNYENNSIKQTEFNSEKFKEKEANPIYIVAPISHVPVATEGTKYFCSNCKISICLTCFK